MPDDTTLDPMSLVDLLQTEPAALQKLRELLEIPAEPDPADLVVALDPPMFDRLVGPLTIAVPARMLADPEALDPLIEAVLSYDDGRIVNSVEKNLLLGDPEGAPAVRLQKMVDLKVKQSLGDVEPAVNANIEATVRQAVMDPELLPLAGRISKAIDAKFMRLKPSNISNDMMNEIVGCTVDQVCDDERLLQRLAKGIGPQLQAEHLTDVVKHDLSAHLLEYLQNSESSMNDLRNALLTKEVTETLIQLFLATPSYIEALTKHATFQSYVQRMARPTAPAPTSFALDPQPKPQQRVGELITVGQVDQAVVAALGRLGALYSSVPTVGIRQQVRYIDATDLEEDELADALTRLAAAGTVRIDPRRPEHYYLNEPAAPPAGAPAEVSSGLVAPPVPCSRCGQTDAHVCLPAVLKMMREDKSFLQELGAHLGAQHHVHVANALLNDHDRRTEMCETLTEHLVRPVTEQLMPELTDRVLDALPLNNMAQLILPLVKKELSVGISTMEQRLRDKVRAPAQPNSLLDGPVDAPDAPCSPPMPPRTDVQQALQVISKAMQEDPDFAWSWHSNIAMTAFDAGAPHAEANARAADFMSRAFSVNTRDSEAYRSNQAVHTQQEVQLQDLAQTQRVNVARGATAVLQKLTVGMRIGWYTTEDHEQYLEELMQEEPHDNPGDLDQLAHKDLTAEPPNIGLIVPVPGATLGAPAPLCPSDACLIQTEGPGEAMHYATSYLSMAAVFLDPDVLAVTVHDPNRYMSTPPLYHWFNTEKAKDPRDCTPCLACGARARILEPVDPDLKAFNTGFRICSQCDHISYTDERMPPPVPHAAYKEYSGREGLPAPAPPLSVAPACAPSAHQPPPAPTFAQDATKPYGQQPRPGAMLNAMNAGGPPPAEPVWPARQLQSTEQPAPRPQLKETQGQDPKLWVCTNPECRFGGVPDGDGGCSRCGADCRQSGTDVVSTHHPSHRHLPGYSQELKMATHVCLNCSNGNVVQDDGTCSFCLVQMERNRAGGYTCPTCAFTVTGNFVCAETPSCWRVCTDPSGDGTPALPPPHMAPAEMGKVDPVYPGDPTKPAASSAVHMSHENNMRTAPWWRMPVAEAAEVLEAKLQAQGGSHKAAIRLWLEDYSSWSAAQYAGASLPGMHPCNETERIEFGKEILSLTLPHRNDRNLSAGRAMVASEIKALLRSRNPDAAPEWIEAQLAGLV
jgi:hypothetical protein